MSCFSGRGREDIQRPMMPKPMPVPEEPRQHEPYWSQLASTTVRLLVDNTRGQILFAEVGKDFVDFLYDLLHLPFVHALELLPHDQPVNTSNLEKLKTNLAALVAAGSYIEPTRVSDNGEISFENMMKNLFHRNTKTYGTPHPSHGHGYGGYEVVEEGSYSKWAVSYMVMDDFVVQPMSAISAINLIKSLDVTDLRGIEEKVVYFGEDEAMKLLKESMLSDKVLTNVFMDKSKEKAETK